MGNKWTADQQRVIDLRRKNLLVSAAAGSGKTAVLIERILSRITDPKDPVDVDRLLVVTFTRAAAEEMKERLGAAIENRLNEDPENENLQRQSQLLHHAQINTIHGFCTYIIKNYYYLIDLDPGYRLAEEDELKLLRKDLLQEFLGQEYEKADPEFLELMEAFSPGRNDEPMRKLIEQICLYALSAPDPAEWLRASEQDLSAKTEEELQQTRWMKSILTESDRILQETIRENEKDEERAAGPGGPSGYLKALGSDRKSFEALLAAEDYGTRQALLRELSFQRLSAKGADADPVLSEQIKKRRDARKARITDLQKKYYGASLPALLQEIRVCHRHQSELTRLVLDFLRCFGEEKQRRNLLDFSDLEHYALQILLEEDGSPSSAAKELSAQFAEVMTDEYQDSNAIQEKILDTVSGVRDGRNNRFMVGDIKQAIYSFRMARPDQFREKYHSYAKESESHCRIDLSQNFRSRPEILTCCNLIFRKLMQPEIGGIEYDETAMLYRGEDYYPPSAHKDFPGMELMLLDGKSEGFEEDGSKEILLETEAMMIGQRILEMRKRGEQVYDKDRKCMRPLEYRDCVVLFRSMSGRAETFVKVLQSVGVPAYAASKSGYFTAYEVVTVLDLLRLIVNPRQELPFTAVLRSAIAGCTDTELAKIRSAYPDLPIYEAAAAYAGLPVHTASSNEISNPAMGGVTVTSNPVDEPSESVTEEDSAFGGNLPGAASAGKKSDSAAGDGSVCSDKISGSVSTGEVFDSAGAAGQDSREKVVLRGKLKKFLNWLSEMRELASLLPVHELIDRVLEESGFAEYAAAMPGGEQRSANLDMLMEKAVAFESTSYHGLFQFIRYIEQLKKYQVDYGEANLADENADTVRIMTIHKSKGLEFPVVFLAGTAKQHNLMDARASVVLHSRLGMALQYVDTEKHVKHSTLQKEYLVHEVLTDTLGEELRLLYVAMTRAKEKLIVTGTASNLEKLLEKNKQIESRPGQPIPLSAVRNGKSYLEWILAALADHPSMKPLYQAYGLEASVGPVREENFHAEIDEKDRTAEVKGSFYIEETGNIRVCLLSPESILLKEMNRQSARAMQKEHLPADSGKVFDPELSEFLNRRDGWIYQGEGSSLPVVLSVSEIKRRILEAQEEDSSTLYPAAEEDEISVPAFRMEKSAEEPEEKRSGAARGTIYHRIFECIDYLRWEGPKDLELQLSEMEAEGKLAIGERRSIRLSDFEKFRISPLGQRMRRAAEKGQLHREQPFLMEVPAGLVFAEWPDSESLLIQGIIDAWFEEDGSRILVDYKTDRTESGEELVGKYRPQLELYGRAMAQGLGSFPEEIWIYSTALASCIKADCRIL